ncbi:hypothetical protein LOTGIDRAFT_123575 [Lottia gigantea]|uniref:gamma-glutamylcyclotransferase n=1 Tax=Lottia gigantea TaxID=225164 RepID=V4AAL5_LOTGI|nr:hypothetical protein LOTGIDRAFT_123575 [Lottia gigantea]ESO90326.1 hypothetical protein LOTGIDRAFT_123575 [Lottia gigantea]
MGMFLYFSFGSNLLKERIRISNPSAVYQGIGQLKGYRFRYGLPKGMKDPLETRWRGSAATIEKDVSQSVWGTLWTLNDTDRPNLDRQEYTYTPIVVNVVDEKGKNCSCLTYQIKELEEGLALPSPQYKDVVLRGARQSKLPEEYIMFLESLPDNGFEGRVEVYEKVLKLLENNTP